MTQLDSEGLPTAILERAREALSPRDADQARVLSALEQRLGLPPHVSHLPDNNPQPERSNSGELGGATMKMLEAKRFGLFNMSMPRWAASALIPLAGVAAISIFVANRSSHPQAAVPKRQATRPVAAAVTETSLPDALDLALAQAEIKTPKPAERPVDAAPADKKPPRKKCRAANGVERPCAPTTKPTPTAVASASPPPAASLSKELAALREAQQALRKGQPTQALEVLTRFEHEAPGPGAMQEERFAAATMARCALSAATGSELYTQFTQSYPNSAYNARVRRLCLPKQ